MRLERSVAPLSGCSSHRKENIHVQVRKNHKNMFVTIGGATEHPCAARAPGSDLNAHMRSQSTRQRCERTHAQPEHQAMM